MFHCPHCGSSIHKHEQFCVICGKKLPQDIEERVGKTRIFNKWWLMPIGVMLSVSFILAVHFFISEAKIEHAKQHYTLGAEFIEEQQFEDASIEFEKALSYHSSFTSASIAFDFLKNVEKMEKKLENIPELLAEKQFNEALEQIDQYENELSHLQGQAINDLIDMLSNKRNTVELEKIKTELVEQPSIERLKVLLWDAESIKNEEGIEVTEEIRTEIVDYTFSKASEQLNNNQFNDALLFVEDGLKYASESTKLQSLKTTIDKEKTAFETAQQERIEQAITIAEEEEEHNRNDAVELDKIDVKVTKQGNVVIKGRVKSGATVPITSVFVEYELYRKGEEPFTTNRVFVFPDVLYPDEYGQFEFTHYDVDTKEKDILMNVNKITWYID